MSENQTTIVDFVKAWNAMDYDGIMSFFTSDCVYHNIPMAPAEGLEAIGAVVKSFVDMASETDWIIHHIAVNDDGIVMTERTDRFLIGANWVELPVMGIFELAEGKIRGWRDYFDMAQFQNQLAGGGS